MSGGQPGGARLLDLARRELLEAVLTEASGEARYRLRLIANAMKIAARELEASAAQDRAGRGELCAFARTTLGDAPETAEPEAALATLRDALRSGQLDGDATLYALLADHTAERRRLLG